MDQKETNNMDPIPKEIFQLECSLDNGATGIEMIFLNKVSATEI